MCLEMVHRGTVSWLNQRSQDISKCLDDFWFVICSELLLILAVPS